MANKRKTIYYEFWKLDGSGMLFKGTGTRTVGANSITTGVDIIPTAELTIPLEDLPAEEIENGKEPNMALYIVKIFYNTGGINKYTFIGTVDTLNIDYAHYTATMNLSHRVARMREWVMPTGYIVKNATLSHVFGPNGADLGYSSTMGPTTQVYDSRVEFEFQDGVGDTKLEMSFSSTNKLEAMQEALNNTENVHFVVDLYDGEGDKIIFGEFGQDTDVLISTNAYYEDNCTDRDTSKYVTMLTEPTYAVDYTDHYNRAVVFCGDVAEGVMHLTLKDIYDNPELQDPMFPVGMYDHEINIQPETEWKEQTGSSTRTYNTNKINNEKVYKDYDIVAYANNDNREYYVTDLQQLREDQVIKHTVYNFADLYPIPALERSEEDPETGETETIELAITDDDRREITKRAYWRAIRILKAQRPDHAYQFNSTPLPKGFQDGQKVNFYFAKRVNVLDADCDNDPKPQTIALIQRTMYMTRRVITFDPELNEINTITLDRELRSRDVNAVEWELKELAEGGDGTGGSDWYDDVYGMPANTHGQKGYDPSL